MNFLGLALANLGTFIGGAAGAFIVANAEALVVGALLAGGLAYSGAQARKAKRRARDQFNASQVDRLVNVSTTTGPRELVLGRVRKGGQVIFRGSTGANRTTFAMVIALAAHEIDAVEQVWFNDTPIELDGDGLVLTAPWAITHTRSGWATGTGSLQTLDHTPIAGTLRAYTGTPGREGTGLVEVEITGSGTSYTTEAGAAISYQYLETTSNAQVKILLGTDDQASDALLQALFPGTWSSSHRMRGVAGLVCIFTYDESSFPTGLPVVTATIRGAKCYDPRQNLLTYSQAFDNGAWVGTATVTANSTTAPDGTLTADTLTDGSAALQRPLRQEVTVADDTTTYCASIFVRKTAGGTSPTFGFNLYISGGIGYPTQSVRVNTDTGEAVSSGNAATVESVGDYWRVSQYLANTGGGFTTLTVQLLPASGAYGAGFSDSGTATGAAVVWGAMVNVGETALPYTPSTATAVAPATAWTENPALQLRHVYQHASFGRHTLTSDETARVITAAVACDRSTAYLVDGTTYTAALYRGALVVPYGTAARDVFDDLAQAMAGSWAFAGGELYLHAGVHTPSVMALDESDLAVIVRDGAQEQMHAIEILPHRERVQKANTITPTIWDADQSYRQAPLVPVTDADLVTRDGAVLGRAVDLPAVPYHYQAQHVCGVMMRDERDPLTVVLYVKARAYPLELFDTIDVTIARYGWSAKLFRVLGREWTTSGLVKLTLKETAEEIYALDAEFQPQGYAENTTLPSPWYVAPVGTLTVTSGTDQLLKLGDGTIRSRMRIAWPAHEDSAVTTVGQIEVQYRSVTSDGEWTRQTIAGSETQIVVADVLDGDVYSIRARARTSLGVSDWSTQVVHAVVGKTEAPPPFDSFLVLAQPDGTRQYSFGYAAASSRPVDWLGAEIRYIAGSVGSPDWDAMTPLQDATTYYTHSPVELNAPMAGQWTFACRSVDTSGNYSPALTQVITLPDRRLGTVAAEYWEHVEGWLGTRVGLDILEGYLQAQTASTWSTSSANWSGWTRWAMSIATPDTYETPARDLGATVVGDIATEIDADSASAVVVDMATSDDGSTWSGWSTAGPFQARHIKLRITVTGTTSPYVYPIVRSFYWQVLVPLTTEYINDLDISTLTGSYRIGTGDIRIPLVGSYSVLKRTEVVIQDSTAGSWTATRIDQDLTYGPRWQFRLGGTLTDPALVDFFVEGY